MVCIALLSALAGLVLGVVIGFWLSVIGVKGLLRRGDLLDGRKKT